MSTKPYHPNTLYKYYCLSTNSFLPRISHMLKRICHPLYQMRNQPGIFCISYQYNRYQHHISHKTTSKWHPYLWLSSQRGILCIQKPPQKNNYPARIHSNSCILGWRASQLDMASINRLNLIASDQLYHRRSSYKHHPLQLNMY
jgi:hypothetical protein